MATTNLQDPTVSVSSKPTPPTARASILVSLSPCDHIGFTTILANLAAAFPGQPLIVATPDPPPDLSSPEQAQSSLRIVPYTATVNSRESWILTAPDFLNAYKMATDHGATSILLLGAEAASLSPESLRALINPIHSGADLATPTYVTGPRDGLVNSAILYPVSRALFGSKARFPLAIDLGLSLRLAERLAAAAQRFTAINQTDAIVWPVAEAAAGNFTITETPAITRALPQPGTTDLNAILARVAGSLFADADLKATVWQRIRTAPTLLPTIPAISTAEQTPDITSMLDTFRIAYTNLAEIWSLVLPPNSLLGLKRLSVTPASTFRMPDALWARTVYDFLLAYRLRTLNRGHLLGALTPLYLAWVASHLTQSPDAASAEAHVQSVAAAFESEKPYLVSRWRWPDRFNP